MPWHFCEACGGLERDDCKGRPVPTNPRPDIIPTFDKRWHGGARLLLRTLGEHVQDKMLVGLLKDDVVGIRGEADLMGWKLLIYMTDDLKAFAMARYTGKLKEVANDLYRAIAMENYKPLDAVEVRHV